MCVEIVSFNSITCSDFKLLILHIVCGSFIISCLKCHEVAIVVKLAIPRQVYINKNDAESVRVKNGVPGASMVILEVCSIVHWSTIECQNSPV